MLLNVAAVIVIIGVILQAALLYQTRRQYTKGGTPSASHNTGSPKLPTIDECYQAIPFPSDERECAMFVAGIAECHKFVGRQLRASA